MPRYKGQRIAKANENGYTHFVDVAVPPGGLGRRLDEMYDFHLQHGIEAKCGHGRHDAGGTYIRWCFAEPAIAKLFAARFGTSLTPL
jgi:hypothetical protein